MFYSDAENWAFEERGRGFVDALKRAGHDCAWIRWHQSPVYRTDREQWKRQRDVVDLAIEAGRQTARRFRRERRARVGCP